jgi:fumarate reductase flavoprotein subunit
MIKEYFPTAAYHGDWTYAVHMHAPYILGDAIKLGKSVGADIVGHDTGLLLPTSGLAKFIEAWLPPWLMLVNVRGFRFMDESATYAVSGYIMNGQPEKRAYAIFDDPTLTAAGQDMKYANPYGTDTGMPTWDYAMLRHAIADGKIIRADTIVELAHKISIDSETLENTIQDYNTDCDKGCDSQFFKDMPERFPIRTGPFYAREVRSCVIGQTGAGLSINTQAEVLDEHGRKTFASRLVTLQSTNEPAPAKAPRKRATKKPKEVKEAKAK